MYTSTIDSNYLCQLTVNQIQEILVLNGVLIQQYQPQLHQWQTVAQLPDLSQSMLSLEPDKVQEINLRLHRREIVEFTAMTTVMNINICDRYVFIPLLEQSHGYHNNSDQLWGRICLLGNQKSIWTPQDLSWVQALGQQLLTAINIRSEGSPRYREQSGSGSPLDEIVGLIERIAELDSKCQQQDEFINTISHDLRAPLMNIKMAARMLKISLDTDEQIASILAGHRAKTYLALLERECDREVEAIDNILELQRIKLTAGLSGRVQNLVESEFVEIASWLTITLEPFRDRANTRHQILTTTVSEWLPTIAINRGHLTKILTELVNNACKYTQVGGKITVEVDSNPNAPVLNISIKNQAEIPAQYLPHLFDQFYRVPGSDRDGQGGTGLGLSIVHKLVQQLNGQIHVASINGWTEVAIKIPTIIALQNRGNNQSTIITLDLD